MGQNEDQGTVDGWLKAARKARTAEKRGRLIDKALAHAGRHIWPFCAAAKICRDDGDAETAKAILAHFERSLANGGEGYQWGQLATAYCTLADDEAAALRCLTKGEAVAVEVNDFCALATLYKARGHDVRALAALDRAQTIARGTEEDLWQWRLVSDVYREALGDVVGARGALDQGLAQAKTVTDCVDIAKAWQTWSRETKSAKVFTSEMTQALVQAESHIQSATDWVELAAAYHSLLKDSAQTRHCLEGAVQLRAGGLALAAVAQAYRFLLDDDEAAVQVMPFGLSPDEIAEREDPLPDWGRDASGLLDWLRPQITDAQLKCIAEADYGYQADANLEALRKIRDSGLLPHPISSLLEVLELTRWGQGDHVERAFACTLLCIDLAGPESRQDSDESTLAVLLESCIALGPEAVRRLPGLTACMGDGLFCLLALLLAAACHDPADTRLAEVVRRIYNAEAEWRSEGYAHPEAGFILGATFYNQRIGLWRRLAREILGAATENSPERTELRAVLTQLGA